MEQRDEQQVEQHDRFPLYPIHGVYSRVGELQLYGPDYRHAIGGGCERRIVGCPCDWYVRFCFRIGIAVLPLCDVPERPQENAEIRRLDAQLQGDPRLHRARTLAQVPLGGRHGLRLGYSAEMALPPALDHHLLRDGCVPRMEDLGSQQSAYGASHHPHCPLLGLHRLPRTGPLGRSRKSRFCFCSAYAD